MLAAALASLAIAIVGVTQQAIPLLTIIAVVFVVAGVWKLIQGDPILGVVLIILGLLVGPGGVSIFT